ncbi:MAG: polyamine aminopropyltransferase [bacterium]
MTEPASNAPDAALDAATDAESTLPKPGRVTRWVLALVVLFLGGSGLVYEYCLSTVATHLLGNSIEQFSVIIALMLFAMGLAGMAQGWLKKGEHLAAVFVAVEVGLGVIGGASAVLLYLAFAYLEHFRLVLYALAMSIGFAIGMEIPLLIRVNQRWQPQLRQNVGQVFSLDYLGALGGALIWAFLLLPLFALDRISMILGLVNLGVALVTLGLFWRHVTHRVALCVLLAGATVGLTAFAIGSPRLIVNARQHLYTHPIQHHEQSAYQDIVITGGGARLTLYLNGRLQLDSEDEFIYHELLVHAAMMAHDGTPKRVLVLGGGDGLAVREVLKWPGVEQITLVDLDPAMTRLARTYEPLVRLNHGSLGHPKLRVLPPSGISPGVGTRPITKYAERPRLAVLRHQEVVARVRVRNLDADKFLADVPGRWDVVIADFPDPRAPDLAKLYSLEFYQQLRHRLAPGGVLITQSGSPYATRGSFWCIHDTIRAAGYSVLPLQAHIPTFGVWGFNLARIGRLPVPAGDPPAAVRTRYLTGPALAAAMIFPPHISRPPGSPRRISTRLDPVVMRLYLRGEPLTGALLFPGRAGKR